MLLEELSNHSLQGLRVFAYVALLGSLSEAAKALSLSQPAVSLQITNLENQLGFALFKKQGRRNVLTAQGQAFLNRLVPQLEKLEQILVDARTHESLVKPRVALGSMQGVGEHWLVDRVLEFRNQKKDLSVHLELAEEIQLKHLLETAQLELIVTPSRFEHPRVISRVLMQEEFIPVGSKTSIDHLKQLLLSAEQKPKFWQEINWVGYGDSSFHDPWPQRWLEHNDFLVTKHFEFRDTLNSYAMIKKLLMAGLENNAICVMPRHVCAQELKNKQLFALENERFQCLPNKLYLSYREKSLNAVHKEFRDFLLKE